MRQQSYQTRIATLASGCILTSYTKRLVRGQGQQLNDIGFICRGHA